tara:strand:+ start:486 stop:866 length:381 start_codon:yes stop_codon:yes gene_type:complete
MYRAKIERVDSTIETFQDCSICLKPMKKLIKRTACGHCYHPKCLNKWIVQHANCPLCRAEVQPLTTKNNRNLEPVRRNLAQEFENIIEIVERFQNRLEDPSNARITITNNIVMVEDDDMILFSSYE